MGISLRSILVLTHLIGLALGMGAATAKATLLLRARSDRNLVQSYLAVVRPLTRLIALGMVLLTFSGVVWLFIGFPLTPLLTAKLVLVVAIWMLGPVIDRVLEPAFRSEAPSPGQAPTSAFVRAERRYLLGESAATGLFYVIVLMWVLG